jgi:hypothetical protein
MYFINSVLYLTALEDEFERIWKEEVVVRHFPGGTTETHDKFQSRQAMSGRDSRVNLSKIGLQRHHSTILQGTI